MSPSNQRVTSFPVALPVLYLQAEGPVAVDALLTRVFALSTHPDKNRRLGGLMAFNQLCRPLREETALLDRCAPIYWCGITKACTHVQTHAQSLQTNSQSTFHRDGAVLDASGASGWLTGRVIRTRVSSVV